MSTTFGILTITVDHNKLVDEDGDLLEYISHSIFESVFFRGNNSRWLKSWAKLLPDDHKVYAIDNTQQGIFTIGDIKKFLEDETNT